MYLKKIGNSLQLQKDNTLIATVTDDSYLQSYFSLVKDIQNLNIEKAQSKHDGTLIMKALKIADSNSIELENLIGTGKTEITKDGLGGFDDIVGYAEEKYCKNKNVSKQLPRPSELVSEQLSAEHNELISICLQIKNLIEKNPEEFKRRASEFLDKLEKIYQNLELDAVNPARISQDLLEKRISPEEAGVRLRKFEKMQRQNYLAKVLSPPSEITFDDIKKADHPLWREINLAERYRKKQELKKFLESFPKEPKKPQQKFQTGGWGLTDEAEKKNKKLKEESGMPINLMKMKKKD